jgi:hypothetical protein
VLGQRVVETHGDFDFFDRDILPGDANGILSEPPRRRTIVVLPSNTTTAGPTLEPGSVEGILLRQIGKSQVRRHNAGPTMVTFSNL